jgi:hypothetical protein
VTEVARSETATLPAQRAYQLVHSVTLTNAEISPLTLEEAMQLLFEYWAIVVVRGTTPDFEDSVALNQPRKPCDNHPQAKSPLDVEC